MQKNESKLTKIAKKTNKDKRAKYVQKVQNKKRTKGQLTKISK